MANESSSRLISLADLFAKPQEEIEFLVEGMLIKAGLGLLAGKPKAGKSTLARVLALSVSRGEPFLGLPCRQGVVLYYGLEEKESEVRRHFEDMGANGSEPIIVSTQPIPGKEILTLESDIKKYSPSLVIIDPLFRAVRVKETNSYAEISNALEPYLFLARASGVHILFVHHLGKGDRRGADAILGSTAIRGAFDVNIMLNRTEYHRTIQSENRYGTDLEETVLIFDDETRLVSLGDKRPDSDGNRVTQSIKQILENSCPGLTQKEIESKVSGRTESKRVALRKLLESGQIQRTGTGNRGDQFIYTIACTHVPTLDVEQGNKKTGDKQGSLF